MAVSTCLITSLTLKPGEPFVLPPGAIIIGASDANDITSTCVDLNNLEALACYCFQILFTEESGSTTPVFKDNNVAVQGLFMTDTNTLYPFSSTLTGISSINTNIENSLYTTPSIGGIIKNVCITYDNDSSGDTGQVLTICFKTLPSIGNNLFLKTSTGALLSPNFTGVYYLPALAYANVESPKCGCVVLP